MLFLLAVAGLVAAAVALRAWHQQSAYEVFMDEIEYSDVGNSFADGRGPQLFGAPFFLHPALTFALLGQVIGTPVPHMTVPFVLSLRHAVVVFGAVNVALVVGVARQVVGRWPALVAGALYALDPFVLRFDSRLMLESPMLMGVLAGVGAMLVGAGRSDRRARIAWLVAAGVLMGVAVTTKSTAALVTSVPLFIMMGTGWGLRRLEALGVFAAQCGVYLAYLGWIVVTGNTGAWFEATVAGVFRASGVTKETGFTSDDAPSFTSRLVAQLGQFAPAYALIMIATTYAAFLVVVGWQARVPRPIEGRLAPWAQRADALGARARALPVVRTGVGVLRRIGRRDAPLRTLTGDGPPSDVVNALLAWFAGILVAIVYTVGLGELEEQTFYLLAVPSTVVIALLVAHLMRLRVRVRVLTAALLTVMLAGSGAIWWNLRTHPDDAYRRLVTFMYANIDTQNEVALGEQTAQFVLPDYGVHKLTSIDDARATFSRYALVSTQLSSLGLAPAKSSLIHELDRRYTLVFTTNGRTSGDLRLYDLNEPLDGSPPVAPGPPH